MTNTRLTVTSICTCAGFNQFKKFCESEGITYVDEITATHLQAYNQLKGVGKMKQRIVEEKIKEIIENEGANTNE